MKHDAYFVKKVPGVVAPLATQQQLLLQRKLVYTGSTRGEKLVVLIEQMKRW